MKGRNSGSATGRGVGGVIAADDLPRPLTFFLTERERREVVRVLGRRRGDRARALLEALRVRR